MKHFIFILLVISILFKCGHSQPNKQQTFCQRNRCLTCIGKYCTTTCRGAYCEDCPLGNCCNSTNCNICRGAKCCATEECNDCINSCLRECEGQSTCHFDCFQKCLSHLPPEEFYNMKLSINTHSNNYLPVNVTTIINVTNTINNTIEFYNPIIVNSTNVYNATVEQPKGSFRNTRPNFVNDEPLISNMTNIIIPSSQGKNCCEVIHPEICESPRNRCITRKHTECSSLCYAKLIHIFRTDTTNNTCIFIAVPPYYYCRNYATESCDKCYECEDCARCTRSCQRSMKLKSGYNVFYQKNPKP